MLSLRPVDIAHLVALLKASGVRRAVAFGSRARGDAKPGADLDLAVEGIRDRRALAGLRAALDESAFPFACDVVDLGTLEPGALRAEIERHGRVLYETP